MIEKEIQIWDLWYPKAAAIGIPFARCRIDAVQTILVHACPPVLTVSVMDDAGNPTASGKDLEATQESPITRLTWNGKQVQREDIWPGEADLGSVILLPGGEAGILKSWWHREDHKEWRWQVEFYNRVDG